MTAREGKGRTEQKCSEIKFNGFPDAKEADIKECVLWKIEEIVIWGNVEERQNAKVNNVKKAFAYRMYSATGVVRFKSEQEMWQALGKI